MKNGTLNKHCSRSYPNPLRIFELIISDNASTDRTGEICLTFAAKDPRVRYSRMKTNVGAIANANHLVQLANAPYFFFASGHDIRHESFIARCIEILEHDTSVVLCYPATRWLEPDGHLGDVMSGQPDTRGQSQASRFRTVLWGLLSGKSNWARWGKEYSLVFVQ